MRNDCTSPEHIVSQFQQTSRPSHLTRTPVSALIQQHPLSDSYRGPDSGGQACPADMTRRMAWAIASECCSYQPTFCSAPDSRPRSRAVPRHDINRNPSFMHYRIVQPFNSDPADQLGIPFFEFPRCPRHVSLLHNVQSRAAGPDCEIAHLHAIPGVGKLPVTPPSKSLLTHRLSFQATHNPMWLGFPREALANGVGYLTRPINQYLGIV